MLLRPALRQILFAPRVVALTNPSNNSSESDLTTYTFSTQALGDADPGRHIIVACSGESISGGSAVSSITIAGITATILKQKSFNVGGVDETTAIAIAAVPTGTTGDVVIVFSAGMVRGFASVFRMVGGSATAHATAEVATGTTDPPTLTIAVPGNGGCVACVGYFATSGTTTWTGLTEAYDNLQGTATFSSAYANFTAAQAPLTVTADPNNAITRACLIAVSFSPS